MQDLLDSQSTPAKVINDHNGHLKGRKKDIQKRAFTSWMNVFLQRRHPPLKVYDLFTDIQDGSMLMALLEELSGCKLLYRFRSSSHRIFRLNNISKALAFLDDRHVRLLDIDASSIADGIPSVVLNLIWNIILHFQVKEATGGLQRRLSSSLSSLSLSAYPSTSDISSQTSDTDYSCNTLPRKGKKAAREPKYHSKAIKTLLHWVQRCTSKFGVVVDDFGASWRSGLAFLALIKSINPDLVDLRESLSKEPEENIQKAFMVAHQCLDVPPLLEPEDVMCSTPDEQSIITYVSMFLGFCSVIDEDHMANCDFPEIPSFGSIGPVGFGGTLADDPEACALLRTFETSSEQQLWKQWSKTIPCSSIKSETSFSSNQRALEPPSPLEAGVANQEIRSWMERGHGRIRVHKSLVSQSSEEGIYTLSALDSDEEDAYSYILDLNKDVFQPNNPSKRQVLKVEEETAEEIEEESKHLETLGMFNGGRYKQGDGPLSEDTDFNPESADRAQSAAHRKFDLDKSRNGLRETTNNRAVFALEPEAERGRREDLKFRRGTNSDASMPEESNEKMQSDRKRKTQCGVAKASRFEAVNGKHAEEEGAELSEKLGHTSERTAGGDLGRLKEGKDLKQQSEMEEASVEETETRIQECVKSENYKDKTEKKAAGEAGFKNRNRNMATVNNTSCKAELKMEEACHLIKSCDCGPVQTEDGKKQKPVIRRHEDLIANDKTSPKRPHDDIHEGDNGWTAACRPSSQSFRNDGGLSLRSIAAGCNINPLELEILLLLWILLYCYLILPQMYNQSA